MSLWGQHCPSLCMNASYDLSVSFRGWKNIPPASDASLAALHARYGLTGRGCIISGECALLEIANNGTRELRSDILAIEYKAEGNWQRVVPKNWPWPFSSSWSPGISTFPVPRPAEVPRDAPWRVQLLCCPEGETDDRHKARMETPEIPPIGRLSE